MSDEGLLVPGLEKGIYSSFRQTNATFRQGQVGTKLVTTDKLQLPAMSVLHICDQYLNHEVSTIYPDLNNPLIHNESFHKYLDFVVHIPSKDALKFPVADTYRFRPLNYTTDIRKFYTTNKDIYRITSRSILSQANLLPIFDYNVISTTLVTGQFNYYRKFDILLRSILANVASIEGRHQYLQFELSKTLYKKSQFQQTFDKINYQTVRVKNDPSFYLLIHLINFLSKDSTTSLFSQLTQVQLDQLNVILTAGDKAIIYNLGDMKAIVDTRQDNNFYQMVIRHISTLKLAGYENKDITELDDKSYDELMETHAHDDSHVSATPEKTLDTPHATHIITGPSDNVAVKPVVTPEEPEEIVHAPPVVKTTGSDTVLTPIHEQPKLEKAAPKPIVHTDEKPVKAAKPLPSPVPYDTNRPTSVIDNASHTLIVNNPNYTDAQKHRLLQLSQTYKTLTLDGVSLEELLDLTPEPVITDGNLEFLKVHVPDQSMLKSTAIDLDRHYVQHMMAKDIAAVAAQMATNGMFLVGIEQHESVTQLNKIKYYKLSYEDMDGRRHKAAFKLPIVSHDGTILVNGITSRMIKQQVNLPICKIDSNRVSLASNYNKTIVERIATKAHSYDAWIIKYIHAVYKEKVGLDINYGALHTDAKLPYNYTCIANRYSHIRFGALDFTFDYTHRFGDEPLIREVRLGQTKWKVDLGLYEKKYGILCGRATVRQTAPVYLFFGYDNIIRAVSTVNEKVDVLGSFEELLFRTFADKVEPPKPLSEWTELKILDKNFPISFILGFQFGLKRTLEHIKLDYKFYPKGTRYPRSYTTISVPFADGNLVFDRYPLEKSYVAAGLLKFDTRGFEIGRFDSPDGYYTLLEESGFSMNYLKGITDFFRLFVDPITSDVLLKMHEPTDPAGLLLRATQMLVTQDYILASSMKNHRLRGYERFASILYNEMARTYATFANQRGNKKLFSVNPEAVFMRIIQDQTLQIVDEINPIENLKDKHALTYAGMGGRTAQSFVVEDRRYPPDAVGVLSECTPDSGKVAINSYVTASPVIQNIRGMFETPKDIEKLEPSQVLSVTSLLMPSATQEDAKRANYINVQLKHHVPSQFSETNYIRTGYETVVAHRTSETFACVAQRGGVIEEVNNDLGLIRIRYDAVKHPVLNLNTVWWGPTALKSTFTEMAHAAYVKKQPIYLVQDDGTKTTFKRGEVYTFGDMTLKVQDIIPLNVDHMTFDYLTDAAKATLRKSAHPVQIKFVPALHDVSSDVDIFKFGTKFTSVQGSYLKQTIIPNVKQGDKVPRGYVLAYNTGFFERDMFDPSQISWKHGVMANVVLMECDDTIEDSNAITSEFSHRMQMEPAHLRALELDSNTIMRDMLPVGTHVQTTDLLCSLDDADIASLTESDDPSVLDMLTEMNRKAPRARYHGIIEEIDVLYSCQIEDMHPTVAAFVTQINKQKMKMAKAAKGTSKSSDYVEPALVPVGTKYHGTEFGKDTILILVYISEKIDHGNGDKLVVMNQLKSITATVVDRPLSTASGYPVDMLFSARGVNNRIVLSPIIVGVGNRNCEALGDQAVQNYFAD